MQHVNDEDRPEVGRRGFLRVTAVGGLTLPVLAACGGSDTGGSGSAGSSESPSDGAGEGDEGASGSASEGSAGGTTVAKADVPVGGGTIIDDTFVVTQPAEGEFLAFSAICTHQGCPVTEITGGEILCKCHGSRYSIEDGSVLGGPAPAPLPEEPVSDDGDQLTLG
jgi:Rieske Fe-S protein